MTPACTEQLAGYPQNESTWSIVVTFNHGDPHACAMPSLNVVSGQQVWHRGYELTRSLWIGTLGAAADTLICRS